MSRATLRARLGVTAASLITIVTLAAAPTALAAPAVTSAPAVSHSTHASRLHAERVHHLLMKRHNALVRKVLVEARRQKGKPYIYGDAGPHGFDCSGLVRYVFMHAAKRVLPHNAAAQYHVLPHISRKQLRPGDLIFTDNGGITHVGIYDGHDHWWVAPHTGTHVQRQRIYRAHFVYARVLTLHHH